MIIIEIVINKESGVPIYLQVKKQITDLIKIGTLKDGQKMPTERELSENLKLSRNTISSAYNELEQDGILKSYQGRGTFVAEEDKPWKNQNIRDKIVKFIDLGFEEALETGMNSEEFLEIIEKRVKEKLEQMNNIKAIYVECNIEQSKMFSSQLSRSTNMNVVPLTITDLKSMSEETKKIIIESQVVIATFNHVNEVSELISEFDKEVLGVAINADLETIVKIARYPEGTKFGFISISDQFKFKVRSALESAGLGDLLISYSNTKSKTELDGIIENSNILIVSPGRYKDVSSLNKQNKEIINFLYSLDDGSVKALKSKLFEIKYKV